VLPEDEFPQFASQAVAEYGVTGSPFEPVEGQRYAGALHADSSYMRLSKTVTVPAGAQSAELRFQLSINTEPSYDNVIVEARPVNTDDWTTLPDLNGGTQTDPPAECSDPGFLLQIHPFLRHYFSGPDCTGPGSSGDWNSFTGSTGGWDQVAFDLSDYAGGQVELHITYVTDPSAGGVGAFVDDTRVVIDGVTDADGFEGATSSWTIGAPPAGSPPNSGDWQIGEQLVNFFAGTSTADTLLLGFGLEQLATDQDRAELVGQALGGLLGE
jgi:Immune inhibitor A peptidase M6